MKCYYCSIFSDSDIRSNGQRFCRAKASMTSSDDESCEKFEVVPTYRCLLLEFCTDIKICTARLNKDMEDCKKCRQKRDILEIRRFLGRAALVQQSRPRILIRRESCERTATL